MTIQGVKAEQMFLRPMSVRWGDRHVVVTSHNGEIWDMILVGGSVEGNGVIRICHKEIRGTPLRDLLRLVADMVSIDWSAMTFNDVCVVESSRSDNPCNIITGNPVCFQTGANDCLVTGVPVTNIFSLT